MNKFDCLIIGAGAAGLMCAITAGQRGRKTLVLDHANKPGKKILMSGGGRCNFTNLDTGPENFISHNQHFCKAALQRYQPNDFIELVQKHHIAYHEKTLGQLFCDNSSKDIVNMLLAEAEDANVEILLNTSIKKIEKLASDEFNIITDDQQQYLCDSLVVATGGLSIPTLGASPFGYKIAEQFGIKVWPTRAGLVAFTLHEQDKQQLSKISGVAVDCTTSCGKQAFTEAMLFTHRGLSGPAMLQISSYWQPGETLHINLFPNGSFEKQLTEEKQQKPNMTLKKCLQQYFPNNFVEVFFEEVDINQILHQYKNSQLLTIADMIHKWTIKPNNTEGYRTAEVTLGGVDCDAISSKTFEAKAVPGLYFIGEVLDVTGWLGGYNFQWAWASGYVAGSHI